MRRELPISEQLHINLSIIGENHYWLHARIGSRKGSYLIKDHKIIKSGGAYDGKNDPDMDHYYKQYIDWHAERNVIIKEGAIFVLGPDNKGEDLFNE